MRTSRDTVALLLCLYDVLHYALICVHVLASSRLRMCFLYQKEVNAFSNKYAVLNKAEILALWEPGLIGRNRVERQCLNFRANIGQYIQERNPSVSNVMFLKHEKRRLQEGQYHFVEKFMQIMVKAEGRIPGR